MNDAHAEFLENPEAHAAHLQICAECRAIFAQLDAPVAHQPVDVEQLPLAAWEGASHRSWTFVVISTLGMFAIAVALSAAAGVSPWGAVRTGASIGQWRARITDLSGALRAAALGWQIL